MMLWILGSMTAALAWGVWYILRPTHAGAPELVAIAAPTAVTAFVIFVIVGVFVFRRIRAARALERACARPVEEQASPREARASRRSRSSSARAVDGRVTWSGFFRR